MRKLQLGLVAVTLAAATSVAAAQDAQPRAQGQGRPNQVAMLMQGITLTAEQQPKVDSITKKFDEDRAALRADQTLDRDARMAKQREMSTKTFDAIKALLNDEQKKVFEKNQADMAARMQGGGRPPQN